MAIGNHIAYLLLSFCFTVFVGQTLFKHGRLFLLECLGNETAADSLNMLFLVGFYLVNLAFIFIALRYGETGTTLVSSVEVIGGRVGLVTLIMGLLHFNNLFWCNLARNRNSNTINN